MTVTLTQEVEGLNVGDSYTGADEAWLLASGYASQAGYGTDTGAVLTGTTNAVNIVTGGNLVVAFNGVPVTVALATADTPAQAATKIDTALTGKADAAITSSKLVITGNATGYDQKVTVVGGTGSVLANLGLTMGAEARGTDGKPGVANTGPADSPIATNREFNPVDHQIAETSDLPEGATNDGIVLEDADAPTIAYAGENGNHNYDGSQFTGFANDPASFPLEITSVVPATGPAAGGTVFKVRGFGFAAITGATGVKLGGTNATTYTVVDDKHLTVTAPAHAAGVVDLVLLRPGGGASNTLTETGAFTYTA